ncbi:hypothetical protein CPSG_02751 [Coccidioides posadasii str. Silveira]|uniref:Uncharacterized protein n=1 Tax=Coccidioides posadasii (strain RMSCC 757 / Silveira) TaxID=443226 RepID=E9CY81_COCPS|nr:hypothetical protein CPSG_02751 [Coccidioides posadasii str. Silveira]
MRQSPEQNAENPGKLHSQQGGMHDFLPCIFRQTTSFDRLLFLFSRREAGRSIAIPEHQAMGRLTYDCVLVSLPRRNTRISVSHNPK